MHWARSHAYQTLIVFKRRHSAILHKYIEIYSYLRMYVADDVDFWIITVAPFTLTMSKMWSFSTPFKAIAILLEWERHGPWNHLHSQKSFWFNITRMHTNLLAMIKCSIIVLLHQCIQFLWYKTDLTWILSTNFSVTTIGFLGGKFCQLAVSLSLHHLGIALPPSEVHPKLVNFYAHIRILTAFIIFLPT